MRAGSVRGSVLSARGAVTSAAVSKHAAWGGAVGSRGSTEGIGPSRMGSMMQAARGCRPEGARTAVPTKREPGFVN